MLLPAVIFLLLFYLLPLVQVVNLSFQDASWPLAHYARIFQDPIQLQVLANTLKLSMGVAVITLFAGYPVAYLLATSSERLRRVLVLLVLSSVWISILVRTYAWMVLLGRQGPVNYLLQASGILAEPAPLLYNNFSVYVGMVHIMLPYMILPLYSIMQRIDLDLIKSARSMGASPFMAFCTVFFPLSLPGILAGTLLVFIISIGFFITPALLGGVENTTFVMLIEHEVNQFLNWELAAAMSIVLLAVTLILVAVYQKLLADREGAGSAGFNPLIRILNLVLWWWRRGNLGLYSQNYTPVSLGGRFTHGCRWLGYLLVENFPWLVIIFLLAPLLIIVPLSFSAAPFLDFPPSSFSLRWYETVLSRSDWINPVLTSTRIALAVVLIATSLGVLAAVPLVRSKFRFKSLFTGFLLSPMIVPVIILAVAMHFFSSQFGLAGTLQALILAHVVLALPFVIIVMSNALQSVDENLERVARTLGATPIVAFTRITLRLVRPAVLTSALFAFLVSFDELVVALFLAGPTTKTLPKRLWEAIREEIDPATAAIAVVITLVCLVAMWIAEAARVKASSQLEGALGTRGSQILELRRRGLFR